MEAKKKSGKRPLISVIVPVYQVEKYVANCIQSIVRQTYRNLEILLVDDGSPDQCPAICDEFAKKDPRIVVIHKENGGLSDARNAGLDRAAGDYIGFVDGDDSISPNMYEVLLDRLMRTAADMAVCGVLCVDEAGEALPDQNSGLPVRDACVTADRFLEDYFGPNGWYCVIACNKLYRKELFRRIRYPFGKQHEDEFLIHRIAYQCRAIACVKDRLYYYTQRPESITHRQWSLKSMDLGEALIDQYHFAKSRHHRALKRYAVKRLSYKLELWKPLAEKEEECKLKYEQLGKSARFLLYEEGAWSDDSFRSRTYHRLELLAPAFAKGLRRLLHCRPERSDKGSEVK